jgi:tRNA threonylcarbamoyladenosine modification (KEOPS) complex Cgi121 subunit
VNAEISYRNDTKEAVKTFRPILKALKIRDDGDHPIVFLAAHDPENILQLDECSIQIVVADMAINGMFAVKYTKEKLLRVFIVLNKSLFGSSVKKIKEQRKIAGVHEFVHFIAMVYVATVTKTPSLKDKLLERFTKIVRKLPEDKLLGIYNALSEELTGNIPEELTDKHFRIGDEGKTPDYDTLFYHLMFSKEMFENSFNAAKQNDFKNLIRDDKTDEAVEMLFEILEQVADEKDVQFSLAKKQLLKWVHVYIR